MDGVVTSTLNFRDELERRGHNVYIFATGNIKATHVNKEKNVFLYPGVKFRPYPQYNVALFPYNSIFKLNELKIDIVHAQTPMVMGFAGMMAAKMLRCPVVGSFHTMVTNKPVIDAYYPKNKHLKKIAKMSMLSYLKFFYNSCDEVIAPTGTIGGVLKSYGIPKVNVVPNAVDTSVLNPGVSGTRVRKALGMKPRDKVILYLGRLSREKKIEVLLSAARILMKKDDKVKLVIGGTGPAEAYYKNMARKLGIMESTKFIGFVSQEALPHTYAAADVVCLPSTFETQGIVLIEAMALGKPVVGADYLAIKEMIKNGVNGEKFVPGDYTSCAKRIEKVLNNADDYKDNAVETAREYSKERVTGKLLDVYNLVLSKKAIY